MNRLCEPLFIFWKQVLVIVDAKPRDLGLPTDAYYAVEEVHDVSQWYQSLTILYS